MFKIVTRRIYKGFNYTLSNNQNCCQGGHSNLSLIFQNDSFKSSSYSKNYCSERGGTDNEQTSLKADFKEITNGDPKLTEQLASLISEIEKFRQEGFLIPKKITTLEWKRLLVNANSRTQKLNQLKFIAINEFKDINAKKKKLEKMAEYQKRKEDINISNHLDYSVANNSMFRHIRKNFSLFSICRVTTAIMHSNDIVIDLGYEEFMSNREMKECAKQLAMSSFANKDHINPLNLHLCNVPTSGKLRDQLDFFFESFNVYNLVHIHTESYTDIFNKKNLVYLSPDAQDELFEYNPEDVYIIGGYVDKGPSLKLSIKKAKSDNIRAVKLPLDTFFQWKTNSGARKTLAINIVHQIMLDLNYYRDMKKALRHVPTRLYCSNGQSRKTVEDFQEMDKSKISDYDDDDDDDLDDSAKKLFSSQNRKMNMNFNHNVRHEKVNDLRKTRRNEIS